MMHRHDVIDDRLDEDRRRRASARAGEVAVADMAPLGRDELDLGSRQCEQRVPARRERAAVRAGRRVLPLDRSNRGRRQVAGRMPRPRCPPPRRPLPRGWPLPAIATARPRHHRDRARGPSQPRSSTSTAITAASHLDPARDNEAPDAADPDHGERLARAAPPRARHDGDGERLAMAAATRRMCAGQAPSVAGVVQLCSPRPRRGRARAALAETFRRGTAASPHDTPAPETTPSPTRRPTTSAPTDATRPTNSWPSTTGPARPSAEWRSTARPVRAVPTTRPRLSHIDPSRPRRRPRRSREPEDREPARPPPFALRGRQLPSSRASEIGKPAPAPAFEQVDLGMGGVRRLRRVSSENRIGQGVEERRRRRATESLLARPFRVAQVPVSRTDTAARYRFRAARAIAARRPSLPA